MDVITHINIGILMTKYCFGEKYLIFSIVFSAIPDIDHILGTPKIIREKKVHPKYRILHEPFFIFIYILIGTIAMILFENLKDVIVVSLYNLVIHYSIDFLIGNCRPLYPISKKEIESPLHNKRSLKIFINIVIFIITTVALFIDGTYSKISNEIFSIFKSI